MRQRYRLTILLMSSALFFTVGPAEAAKTHLLILSGQSNMAGLNPAISFTPAVKKGLAGDEVIVVKHARGGQPIRRWYKNWKPAKGKTLKGKRAKADGLLYDQLMKVVRKAVGDRKPDTVTFIWMQGERDAKTGHGSVYQASLQGLIHQLETDLGRKDVNFVIGRLSDHLSGSKRAPDWDVVRKAQVAVAEGSPRGAWVDTDDLNGPKNGLHYTKSGYAELGKRFAEKAIALIKKAE